MKRFLKNKVGLRYTPTIFHTIYSIGRILRSSFSYYPLRNKNVKISCVPFFIIGSGRSGSTLLRSIITQHPDICIPPESYVLGQMIREYNFYRFLPWDLLVRIVISGFESYDQFYTWEINLGEFYQKAINLPLEKRNLAHLLDSLYMYYTLNHQPDAIRWGDKTPTNTFILPLLKKVFPNAKYIHIIRDGRDVAASYLNAKIYSDVKDACIRWIKSIEIARKFGKKVNSSNYMEVFYEKLVSQPNEIVRKVCTFLTIDYNPEMLNFWKNVDSLGDTGFNHHKNLHNPINKTSIGKWRERINTQDQEVLEKMLREKIIELGYPAE